MQFSRNGKRLTGRHWTLAAAIRKTHNQRKTMNNHPKGVHRERSGEYKVCQQCATVETQVAYREDNAKEVIFEPFCKNCAMKTLSTTAKWAKYTRRKQKGLVF